jgi:hypothetical protein
LASVSSHESTAFELRKREDTLWTRVVAALLLFVALSPIVILLPDFIRGHAPPWPFPWYKTAFVLVGLSAFIPAVFYVAVFGRSPRYWRAFERRLGARTRDRSGNSRRYQFPEWVQRIGLGILILITSGYAILITLASLDRAHTWSGRFILLLAWSLAIGVIVAVSRWWHSPMARSVVASNQKLE